MHNVPNANMLFQFQIWSLIGRLKKIQGFLNRITLVWNKCRGIISLIDSFEWYFLSSNIWSENYLVRIISNNSNKSYDFILMTLTTLVNIKPSTLYLMSSCDGAVVRMQGGFWGVWGAPRPHPGVARGRKTIHFFLWPWHVTG